MKIRNYLVKFFGGKICKQILKIPEGVTAVIKILGAFDFFIANSILDKEITTPFFAVFVGIIIFSVKYAKSQTRNAIHTMPRLIPGNEPSQA